MRAYRLSRYNSRLLSPLPSPWPTRLWVCPARSLFVSCSRAVATASPTADKPYYVTTPIFYVNADPHVGHMYSMVLADVLRRWKDLNGIPTVLSTGVDEHGMKVQQAAAKARLDPKPFCDRGAETFKDLALKANVLNDHFVRTSDKSHQDAVQYAWQLLSDRGYIYKSKHEGWYCVSDETFYPQSGVQLIVEPRSGRKIMASMETGKEVEWTSEKNYHFRLSAFRDDLLSFCNECPDWIKPSFRHREIKKAVREGLQDLSISRPSERLSWGIPVPGDPSQTIYVWLDALFNYASIVGYPWAPGHESAGGWPADVHVIGKDISRFHCIYWPAFLMALSLPLPKHILTHSHWTLGRLKMSKSTGNVVNPFFALDRFGVDTMRFYMVHDGSIENDADYSNYWIIERYKKVLKGTLGNLVSRVTRPKIWSIRYAVMQYARVAELNPSDTMERQITQALRDLPALVTTRMDALDVSGAVRAIVDVLFLGNKYIDHVAPWSRVGRGTQFDWERPPPEEVNKCVYLITEALRLSGILLQPVMPNKMTLLLDMLGVDGNCRAFQHAKFMLDNSYGESSVELSKGQDKVLFPPLTAER
ncbi:methionyl-tRNA synthetase [Lineolata rhizophorae]|uniref:Probable methionine--tRNA ligase, mitochondrial n=1 Tax=Lineolata rhizophorae TaxID=578093 RepID=A0A6A6NYS1_9PEZI|nr:methionyl-tRNA synthetase [Lineolata rhizophorae]